MAGESDLHGDLSRFGVITEEDFTMSDNKNTKLNKEQLDQVVGGTGMRGEKGEKGSDMVRCPGCGAPNTVPAKDGATVICSACGKEFQI